MVKKKWLMLKDIRQQILEAADLTHVSILELSEEASTSTRELVERKFARKARARAGLGRGEFLWERFTDKVGVRDAQAWIWLDDFVVDNDVILFFNERQEKTMFELKARSKLSLLLGETYPFEVYLTDELVDFVLCFNHHDYLIATGRAKEWLTRRIRRGGQGPELNR